MQSEFEQARRVGKLLLLADRVIDGKGMNAIEGGGVLVESGRIVAVGAREAIGKPSDVVTVELRGTTLLPGLIDAHLHLFGVDTMAMEGLLTEHEAYRVLRAARDARRLLAAGFTTVRCLGSSVSPYLARATKEHIVPGPRIVFAGQFVCQTAGTWDHMDVPVEMMSALDMIADGPDACRAIVRRRVRQGARVIKIGTSRGQPHDHHHAWGDSPFNQVLGYSMAEVREIVEEAHVNGAKVSSHSIGDAAVQHAVAGGVDVIEHGHGIADETRELLAERGIIVVPTLSHMHLLRENGPDLGMNQLTVDVAARHLETQRDDFRRSLAAGVRLASGSDLIGPPWAPHGENATELMLMVECGMSEMDAIKAATAMGAEAVGLEDTIGTLERGKEADLIAVQGDPLTDIRAMLNVPFVLQSGVIVKAEGFDGVESATRWL